MAFKGGIMIALYVLIGICGFFVGLMVWLFAIAWALGRYKIVIGSESAMNKLIEMHHE